MVRRIGKILLWALGIVVVLAGGLVTYTLATWGGPFEAPYPAISASTDPAVIERGRYLAYGPAHCAACHVPMDKLKASDQGEVMPLSGGWELNVPPLGTFRAPNLTPDPETGIGRFTDGELARVLRYSVHADGQFVMEFMPFQDMSDEDLTALISFLRSQPPVRHAVPRTEYGLAGKLIFTLTGYKPLGPKATPPARVAREATVEYGKYLANSVASCVGCHTERNPMTGAVVGQPFAGGERFAPEAFTEGYAFMSPNLTPDEKTGVLASWTEDAFVGRFKAGRLHAGSPMPWGFLSRTDSVDVQALYRYFRTLAAVSRPVPKTVFAPGEPLPE